MFQRYWDTDVLNASTYSDAPSSNIIPARISSMSIIDLLRTRDFKSHDRSREAPGGADLDQSGILVVNCRGCSSCPDIGSPVCVRCITEHLSSLGSAERIRLTAGKDTEISGPAVELLCEMATISRPIASMPKGGRCSSCDRSPDRIISAAWADFPDPSFVAASDRLYTRSDDGAECSSCLQRTHAELVVAEEEMRRIRRRASTLASNRGVSI